MESSVVDNPRMKRGLLQRLKAEGVLPTGEICTVGSGSIGPSWFTRGPLPDLPGLFIGWFGTTGIVTKLSLKLFPKPPSSWAE